MVSTMAMTGMPRRRPSATAISSRTVSMLDLLDAGLDHAGVLQAGAQAARREQIARRECPCARFEIGVFIEQVIDIAVDETVGVDGLEREVQREPHVVERIDRRSPK